MSDHGSHHGSPRGSNWSSEAPPSAPPRSFPGSLLCCSAGGQGDLREEDFLQLVSPTTQRLEAAGAAAAASGASPDLLPVRLPVSPVSPTLLYEAEAAGARVARAAAKSAVSEGPEDWAFGGEEGERKLLGLPRGDESTGPSPVQHPGQPLSDSPSNNEVHFISLPSPSDGKTPSSALRERRGLSLLALETGTYAGEQSADNLGQNNCSGADLPEADAQSRSTPVARCTVKGGATRRQPSLAMRLLACGCQNLCAVGAARHRFRR